MYKTYNCLLRYFIQQTHSTDEHTFFSKLINKGLTMKIYRIIVTGRKENKYED